MAIELKMPALSPTMEEGTLAKWLKQEGDEIAIGDIIAEIETDKATMEFEAVDDGVLGKILVPEVVANVCFGGPKRNRLFICATTSLYAVYLFTNGCTPG